MKILLTINKTLSNGKNTWVDGGYYNVYEPLKDLGHDVYFWDTVNPEEPNIKKVIDKFKPDIIFACLTGDLGLAPAEPIAFEEISRQTEKGNIKTFNRFCDDTWRFDNFSTIACKHFHICSTPEPDYIDKYKNIGYDNIIVGGWHTNHKLYPDEKVNKKYDISFIGQINNPDRIQYIECLKENNINVSNFHGISQSEMVKVLCQSKIGINFSKNYNGNPVKSQMKLRPFEIAAASETMVFSEYHSGLEYFFDIDKEIVCFENPQEALKKIKALLQNDKIRKKIAINGNHRFQNEHSSHKRMDHVVREISKI